MKKQLPKKHNGIICPREKSYMTPCVARDGHLALADNNACVGCGFTLEQIVDDYARLVALYVEVTGRK